MPVLGWLNDQLLRMTWLSTLVARLVENVFGLDTAGRLGGSVHFFIYDVIKIFVLLAALVLASPTCRVSFRLSGPSAFWADSAASPATS